MGAAKGSDRRPLAAVVVLIAGMLCAAVASAAEAPARDEYVAQLERVCKPDAEATQRAMKGARADLQAERLGRVAGKFSQAAAIFGSTIGKIAKVPRPSGDLAKLSRWFGYLQRQESYLRQIAAELRTDHAIKAQKLTVRFIHNGNLANNVVLAFGFDYCSFRFSRFG